MIYLVCLLFTLVDGFIRCQDNLCYGHLEDASWSENEKTIFVVPSDLTPPGDILVSLSKGDKFDCGNKTTTLLMGQAVFLSNIKLEPFCLQRQRLLRSSMPTEDFKGMNQVQIHNVVIQERETPCSLIVADSGFEMKHFDLDNQACLENLNTEEMYMRAQINLYSSKPTLDHIVLEDLVSRGKNSLLVHAMGVSRTYPFLNVSDIVFQDLEGPLFMDMLCGTIKVSENIEIIVSSISCSLLLETAMGERSLALSQHMGPKTIVMLLEQLFGFSNHLSSSSVHSHPMVITAGILSSVVTFSITILFHKLREHELPKEE